MKSEPKVNSAGAKELEKAASQLQAFEETVKDLTLDRMNEKPKLEVEPQTKIATSDIAKSQDVYIKPNRSISGKEKFNERFRADWDSAREYVHIIAENREIIGETMEFWTKPFPGVPAEFWKIPANKPVWVPKYVYERIQNCYYHRLRTEDRQTGFDGSATYYGSMVVDNIVNRLDAREVPKQRQIAMGTYRTA